jgi:4-amino-4-deoxy-L-arabinose transferase-like glycosyltransferase
MAVLLFTFLPPILAHAGLATTDLALTALVGAAFLSLLSWFRDPTWRRSLLAGAPCALAVLSKFSALAFIPVSLLAIAAWRFFEGRGKLRDTSRQAARYLGPLLVMALTGFVVIWAGYRFSFGKVGFTSLRLPMPELFAGAQEVMDHNRRGDPSFLLGERSHSGWWYYYLAVLAVKTPLPFLILLGLGVVGIIRRQTPRGAGLALFFSLGILGFSSFSRINLGVRHILPVYLGFAVVAAAGGGFLLQFAAKARWATWGSAGILGWMILTSTLSHPDYLPYFNALAPEPEKVLVDSDLDWGQDLKRLARRLKEVGAPAVGFDPFQPADLAALGFPPVHAGNPASPLEGWNAVSLTVLVNNRLGLWDNYPDYKLWPQRIPPAEKVGKGIWLWYFPPSRKPEVGSQNGALREPPYNGK